MRVILYMKVMRKVFFYNFLPSKAEEEAALARNVPLQVSRTLVEMRDSSTTTPPLPPRIDPNNPWQIRKILSSPEVLSGKLALSQDDVFDFVFRYWNLDMANQVVEGHKCNVVLMDYTDETMVKRFQGENIFLKVGPNDNYVLGFKDLAHARRLNVGDEIGLFLDTRSAPYGTFAFKLFRRGNSH